MTDRSLPTTPALVFGVTRHQRRRPWNHALKFKTYLWLVDLDALPQLPLARFSPLDHFGGEASSIREAVEAFAATEGKPLAATDRVLMLCAPRVFGQVFNPLTTYWCYDQTGALRWAILEIHNTYGDRHAHLIEPAADGSAEVEKEFYVSPFFTIEGQYRVRLLLSQQSVLVSVNLHQQGEQVFSASFAGKPQSLGAAARVRAMLRSPMVGLQTVSRIRFHGIWLWLRKLPVVPRPEHPLQAGMK